MAVPHGGLWLPQGSNRYLQLPEPRSFASRCFCHRCSCTRAQLLRILCSLINHLLPTGTENPQPRPSTLAPATSLGGSHEPVIESTVAQGGHARTRGSFLLLPNSLATETTARQALTLGQVPSARGHPQSLHTAAKAGAESQVWPGPALGPRWAVRVELTETAEWR